MQNIADRIIAKFGGQSALARGLGLYQSAISNWSRVGYVPVRRQQQVLDLARELGIRLSPKDFFDTDGRK